MFEAEVLAALKKAGIREPQTEIPKDRNFGDLAFACFSIAKEFKKNPVEIARDMAGKIKPSGSISKVVAVGPYVNFFTDEKKLVIETVKAALKKDFGAGEKTGKILIEHTSTNPNAPPHVGRARNAIIADSLVRIFKFVGYKVDVHYFVNDIGKQIAMLVYATMDLKGKPKFEEMLRHYIEINRKILENVALEKDILHLLYMLEKGDKKTKTLFKQVVSTCIKGQTDILGELGIRYDSFDYESKYIGSKILKDVLKKLKPYTSKDEENRLTLNLTKFNLPMKSPFVPITREGGTSLYFLRDIAYNVEKAKWAKGGRNIVVLGEDHKLEFQQIKAATSLLGIEAPEVIHYSFILLPEGKMSTRAGTFVLLTDFMKEAVDKAMVEIKTRHPDISAKESEKLAKTIGYGAIKYAILKISSEKNVIFSWEQALSLEGESAPYLQYSHVRASKILEKAGKFKNAFVFTEPEEIALAKKMAEFPGLIEKISKNYGVHALAKYGYELAAQFSLFYEKCPVVSEADETKRNSRLSLVKAYLNVIKNCLYLLGVDVPSMM